MGRASKGALAAFVVGAACMAITSIAGGALPRFSNRLLVINKSVAGLRLGARKSRVTIWGSGRCHYWSIDQGSCVWPAPRSHGTGSDTAYVHWINERPRVASLSNYVVDTIRFVTADPAHSRFRSVKTSRGIGIGSSLSAARRAYPHATYQPSTRALLFRSGVVSTEFFFDRRGRLIEINLDSSGRYPPAKRGVAGIPDAIQNALLDAAKDKLKGFVLSQLGLDKLLGDQTGNQLNELRKQLELISAQLTTLQRSVDQISADLTKVELEGFTVPLETIVSQIQSLYTDFYAPTERALTSYVAKDLAAKQAGSTCSDTPDCAAARQYFDTLRSDFVRQFTTNGAASLNTDLHDALIPGLAGSSVMTAYGDYILKGPGSKPYLTSADSDQVLGFYNYFAEYEALATWMKAQWNGLRFEPSPDEFDRFVSGQIEGYAKEEQGVVGARIPPDVVITLPSDPALRTSTKHMPMWIANLKYGANLRWDPSTPGVSRTVEWALNILNTTSAGDGYSDWKVPSRSELDALFAGRYAAFPTNGRGFLLKLGSKLLQWQGLFIGIDSIPYLWTSDPAGDPSTSASPSVRCVDHTSTIAKTVATLTGYAHTALGPMTNSLVGYPAGYVLTNIPTSVHALSIDVTGGTDANAIKLCKDQLQAQVTAGFAAGAGAQLLATRSTGDTNYLP
jgi:hypothetical protein